MRTKPRRLTDQQWEEIEVKYKAGIKMREISEQYKYDAGNISRRAKKEGWVHGELQRHIDNKAKLISELVDPIVREQEKVDNKLQKLQQNQQQMLEDLVSEAVRIKVDARKLQGNIINTISKAVTTATTFINKHPDGRYIKSKGDKGVTFGLTTDVIQHLTPALNSTDRIINNDRFTTDNVAAGDSDSDRPRIEIVRINVTPTK